MRPINKKVVNRSLRLERDLDEALNAYLRVNNIRRSELIRDAVYVYLSHYAGEQEVLEHYEPEEKERIRITMFEELHSIRKVLFGTIDNMNTQIHQRLEKIEYILEKMIWLHYYFGRDIPNDLKEATAKIARDKTARMMDVINNKV